VLSAYYELTKPGITKMVVLSASAGYYLALSEPSSHFSSSANIAKFILTILGTTLVSGGSCVLNNYIEREHDKLMHRTMKRPLPSGKISPSEALLFGIGISLTGLAILSFVHWYVVGLALLTLASYVAIYTPLKRKTTLSLPIGALPGALPTLGGWVAASGAISAHAWLLFGVLFFWQLPHFLSLSWIYKHDYARGGFKMLAVLDETGTLVARQALFYLAMLIVITALLAIVGITGWVYSVGSVFLCSYFFIAALRFRAERTAANARTMLLSSYFYLLGIIILIFIDKV
jgi:protoheme IX farnesyltransferase